MQWKQKFCPSISELHVQILKIFGGNFSMKEAHILLDGKYFSFVLTGVQVLILHLEPSTNFRTSGLALILRGKVNHNLPGRYIGVIHVEHEVTRYVFASYVGNHDTGDIDAGLVRICVKVLHCDYQSVFFKQRKRFE